MEERRERGKGEIRKGGEGRGGEGGRGKINSFLCEGGCTYCPMIQIGQ